ncbi:MAG: membrane protein insertion efficiency factor YidD [Verrucomicrobiota bacterium]
MNPVQHTLIFAIRVYRWTISPAQVFLFGSSGGCRFTPTCSVYALDAVREHGAATGTALAARRICRCHPWGGCGHDPVPEKRKAKQAGNGNILHPVHS